MWFKNSVVFRLPMPVVASLDEVNSAFSAFRLQPCGFGEPVSRGWVSPRADDQLVMSINQQGLFALGVEERLLPSSVIRQFANERADSISKSEGRQVGRREMRDLREATAIQLLPRAFPRRRTTFAWIDHVNGFLVIDSGAQARAEELLEQLRRTVEGFQVRLLKTALSPSAAMTGWVAAGAISGAFSIDQDIEMRSAENGIVRYEKLSIDGADVRDHIATGKIVTKLAMTWGDRISFVLTENLQLKRISFLDILKKQSDGQAENEEERFDIDFTLMAGEMNKMFADLIDALGGELQEVVV